MHSNSFRRPQHRHCLFILFSYHDCFQKLLFNTDAVQNKQKGDDRQYDNPGIHWRRWSLSSAFSVNTRAVTQHDKLTVLTYTTRQWGGRGWKTRSETTRSTIIHLLWRMRIMLPSKSIAHWLREHVARVTFRPMLTTNDQMHNMRLHREVHTNCSLVCTTVEWPTGLTPEVEITGVFWY